jgi:O-antigen/teichoic acid export membrane protein
LEFARCFVAPLSSFHIALRNIRLRDQLKGLTRDTAIYGVGHIATRLITFLLLPYYSYHLTPAEYGEVTLYFLFVAIAQAFFYYGLDIAYLRYFTLAKEPESRRTVTGTTLIASVLSSSVLGLMIVLAAPALGRLVIQVPTHPEIVGTMIRLCAGILIFDTLATFPFLLLRGTMRPFHFALTKLFNVAINLGFNIWFVGGLGLSIAGIMWANFIASGATLLMLLPVLAGHVKFHFDRGTISEMISFGLPNVPTYLFVMIIELADRKVIEIYRGLQEAGLYSAGYKLGMFMAVVTGAFRFAWQPFFLSHSDREDAPRLFARVLTYYLLVTSFLFLLMTFFADFVLKYRWPGIGCLLEPRYWPGLAVFPIILLAHIFDGVYANLMVGVYLKKLTKKLPLVTGVAAGFTIIFNILLVPTLGMMAAAWITLIAFFMEAVLLWLMVRKAYPVPYEWIRIGKLALAVAIIFVVAMLPSWTNNWWRALLLMVLPVLLYAVRFFDDRELHFLRAAFKRS